MNDHTLMFMGSKKLGLNVLIKIYEVLHDKYTIVCATIDDSNDTRSCYTSFKDTTNKYNIDLYTINKENTLEDVISHEKPILCLVVGWYSIINEDILNLVPKGFIGIHNSLLPKYRGFAPLVWQLINGEESVGYSIFSLEKGMDTGKIWFQERIEVNDIEYINEVLERIEEKILNIIGKVLLGIIKDEIMPKEQQVDNISYCAKRTSNDGKIDWNKNAINVFNFIRAQSKPYPGAYSLFEDKKIIIWKAYVFNNTIYGHPGQLFILDSKLLIICGGNTAIVLEEYEVLLEHIKMDNYKFSLNTIF